MLRLAEIFQNKMVLQRGIPTRIWGLAAAGEIVSAQIQGRVSEGRADQEGVFALTIAALKESAEETLTVKTEHEQIRLEQVAVGEVWIAGGQSNMEFFMEFERHVAKEREACPDADIRFYDVPEVAFAGQREVFDYSKVGVWRTLTKGDIGYFSAVGYYFAKHLRTALDVPVGIIGCNWGGTRIASWMDPDSVSRVGQFWIKEYEKSAAGLDLDVYFEEEKRNPLNDRGSLLENPFYKYMFPTTHTMEENIAFLSQLGEGPGDYVVRLSPENIPGSLYEYMVKTIAGYTVRGVLWYQGESDDEAEGGQYIYGDMLSAMIGDWRSLWNTSLPFLIVQLPGWERWLANENHDYAAIRKAQQEVTELVEHTYLCSIGDVGERFDIHPKDKKTVGNRLALLALDHIYHKPVLSDAPRCISAEWKAGTVVLKFDNTGNVLEIRGGEISGLVITVKGEAATYHASVRGDELFLVPDVPAGSRLTISYAQTAWYQINLYNSAEIPALPFETVCEGREDSGRREEEME